MTIDLAHLEALLELLLQATSLGDVFLAALVEKFIPVLPSYVLYPAIGMGAPGLWDLVLRCSVATLGSLGGALLWYVLGAIIGPARIERLVARRGRWVLLNPRLYERMASTYRSRPLGLTFLGQLVPTVRIFQALPAGVLRLPLVPFLAATALGSFCWITALAAAGHLLHRWGWAAGEAGLTVLLTLVAAEAAAALFTFLVLPAKQGAADPADGALDDPTLRQAAVPNTLEHLPFASAHFKCSSPLFQRADSRLRAIPPSGDLL